jgi:putative transcriptional regulator
MAEKQMREKRKINVAVLSRETNLTRVTITKWINNDLDRFEAATIVTLCAYFNCDIGDLLKLDRSGE